MSDGYNGWSNRETWAANLWIENEEGSYRHALRLTRQAVQNNTETDDNEEDLPCDQDAAVEELASELEIQFSPDGPRDGLAGDLFLAAVRRIDWSEIAQHMVESECE